MEPFRLDKTSWSFSDSRCDKSTEDRSDQRSRGGVERHTGEKEYHLVHISVYTTFLIIAACVLLLFITAVFYYKQQRVRFYFFGMCCGLLPCTEYQTVYLNMKWN